MTEERTYPRKLYRVREGWLMEAGFFGREDEKWLLMAGWFPTREEAEAKAAEIRAADAKAEADRRIRDAAHDLLEALERLARKFRNCVVSGGTSEEYADIAVEEYRALIAKARGETK